MELFSVSHIIIGMFLRTTGSQLLLFIQIYAVMEAKDDERMKLKLVGLAVQKLLDEKRDGGFVGDDEEQRLRSKLLSELESLKEDDTPKLPKPTTETTEPASSAFAKVEAKDETQGESKEMGTEEIVKELRKVKRQNTITHWLLSIMIFATAAWQLSEVSLILKVKNNLSHPFKSVGSMITSAVTGGRSNVLKGADKKEKRETEPPSLPALQNPELPILGFDDE